jgi:hypothetical protein
MRFPDRESLAFSSWRTVAAWAALLAVNVLGILPWLHTKFPIVDLAAMVFDVRRIELGYVPYRDTFTHHFAGYLVPFVIIGRFISLTPFLLKALSVSFNLATAGFVFLTVRDVGGRRAAWLGTFLTVTVGWFWSWQGAGFNIQSYMTPLLGALLFLTVRACLRPRSTTVWWAAAVAGVLFTFDQRAAPFLLVPLIPVVCTRGLRTFRTVLPTIAASAAAPSLALAYLWHNGALGDFIEQTVIFPLYYRNHGIVGGAPLPVIWLAFLLSSEPVTAVLSALGLIAMWTGERRRPLTAVFVGAFLCSAAYSVAGGRVYPYYFLLFGPVAVMVISLLPTYAALRSLRTANVLWIGLAVFGSFAALKPLWMYVRSGTPFVPDTEHTMNVAADYIQKHTKPADGVLVWGFAPQIYVLSDRFNTFRDAGLLSVAGGNFSSIGADEQGRVPHMVTEFDVYLDRKTPRLIAVYTITKAAGPDVCAGKGVIQRNMDFRRAPYLQRLKDVIEADYKQTMVIDGPCDRIELFGRLDERNQDLMR